MSGRKKRRRILPPQHPPDPWDRREGESEKAWAAFRAYRDAGPMRKRIAVARQLANKPDLKSTPASWRKWERVHDWHTRLTAFDRFLAEQARARQDAIASALRARVIDRAEDILETVIDAATMDKDPSPRQLDAAKFALQALGFTAPKQVELSGPGGAPVSLATELQILVSSARELDDEDIDQAELLLERMLEEGE